MKIFVKIKIKSMKEVRIFRFIAQQQIPMNLNQQTKNENILKVLNLKHFSNQRFMSLETSKKNSFQESTYNRTKLGFKIHKIQTQKNISSFKKLPLIKQRKYSSTKNLIVSSTLEITSVPDDLKQGPLTKIKKKVHKRDNQKHIELDSEPNDLKYFFKKRKNTIQPLGSGDLKKYSSCNKLTSFPSIPEMHVPNDESFIQNQNIEPERQIKSSNSIKLEAINYVKKPKLQRIPLKKILKSQMSKTINPRKIESENSIELQNEQKSILIKKRSKLSKDTFERVDSKTKILVKNPFEKIAKKHSKIQRFEAQQKTLQSLQKQFRLSKIFEDTNNESDISICGKSDIENLIGFI